MGTPHTSEEKVHWEELGICVIPSVIPLGGPQLWGVGVGRGEDCKTVTAGLHPRFLCALSVEELVNPAGLNGIFSGPCYRCLQNYYTSKCIFISHIACFTGHR